MSKYLDIPINRLVLDQSNPRLRVELPQDELLAMFAASPKTRTLAKHIVKYGMNPLEAVAVLPIENTRKYTVREGNRRVAALKLLNDPSLAGSDSGEKFFKGLVKGEDAIVPGEALAAVLDSDTDARRWIRLKHVADQNGVGTLFWEPWQKANFDDGTGNVGKYKHAREVVNAALEKGWIGESDHAKLNLSTLSRVFDDEKARTELGFIADGSGLATKWPVRDQEKVLKRVIADTSRGGKETSRTLRTTDNLVSYAQKVVKSLKLKISSAGPSHRVGSSAALSKASAPKSRVKKIPDELTRKIIVPSNFKISIDGPRAAEICDELRGLSVIASPNAVALLFRIFLEFSVERYAELHKIEKKEKDRLRDMLKKCSEHLLAKGKIKKAELTAVNKGLSDSNHFLSVTQLNMYVHNKHIHPNQRELNSAWNGSDALIRALWETDENTAPSA